MFTDALARTVAEMRNQYDRNTWAEFRRDMQDEISEAEALDAGSTDSEGNTPLHICAAFGLEDLGWCLARGGADLEARNKAGDAPLHSAARSGEYNMALILLFAGADVNSRDADGRDAVATARAAGEEPAADMIERQIEEPCPEDLPNTVLYFAASEGIRPAATPSDLGEFGDMLSMMGEAVTPTVEGRTGLHTAAVKGEVGRARLDLTQGVDLDALDAEGNTALHLAVAGCAGDVSELLLATGARSDIPNAHGRSARDWADWLEVPGLDAGSGEKPTVAEWIDLLPRVNMEEDRLEIVYAGLREGGDEAVEALIGGMASENLLTVELSRRAIGGVGAPAVGALSAAVDEAAPLARPMAVQALGEIAAGGVDTAPIAEFLITTVARTDLLDEPLPTPAAFADAPGEVEVFTVSEAIRCAGCDGLASIGESASAAVDPLAALLSDSSNRVRGAAIGALCALGDRGHEAVVAYATGPDAPPPESFAGIFDQLGDAPPPPALLDVLARIEAPQALSTLGSKLPSWFAHGEPSPELIGLTLSMFSSSDFFASNGAERALDAATSIPASALPVVTSALHSENPLGGLVALKKMNLGAEAAPDLAPELAVVLRDSDNYKARDIVEEMLTGFGRSASSATEILMEIVRDDTHRNVTVAAAALGAVATSPEVVTFLEEELNKQSMQTSKGAAAGLGNMGALAKDALPSLEAMKEDFFGGDAATAAIEKIRAEL